MLNCKIKRGIHEDSHDKGVPSSGRFANMRDELIDLAFQPIVNLESASMLGYEVLVRPTPESGFQNPGELISEAVRCGRARELDQIIRRKAMKAIERLPRSQRLFLNNLPQSFAHPDFVREVLEDLTEHPNVSSEQIVLELTEWVGELPENGVDANTLKLRENGVQIALDDVGAGINGLNQLMAVRPDWIKLDRMLISHIDTDGLKQNLVRVLLRFAQLSHLRLIAEGVERREELETLIQLGVSHAQGYFLARPAADFVELSNDLIELIRGSRRRRESPALLGPSVLRIEELAEPVLNLEAPEHWATLRDA
ncbi:MAG: EAL domain-containing protein, partial [Phycisphaerales bacterium]